MTRFLFVFALLALGLSSNISAQEPASKPAERAGVSYGLVVDNSGSYRALLDRVVAVTSDVIEENGPDDEAFLVTFVDTRKIVLRQEFTDSESELNQAAQNMYIEGGHTAIIDAMKSSADYLSQEARKEPGRSLALVLVTDGEDRASETKIDDVMKILKENNIRVFVIAMSETKVVTKILDRFTKETGGAMVTVKARSDLGSAAKQISTAMRSK